MIVIVDSSPSFARRAHDYLSGRTDLIHSDNITETSRIIGECNGEVSVVVVGPSVGQESLKFARELQDSSPEIGVVIVTNALTTAFLQDALRAGVRDVLPASAQPYEFQIAVDRAEALSLQVKDRTGKTIDLRDGAGDRECTVITMLSPKGGVGKSFFASNLAVSLARRGDVAIVDLDLHSGDLAIMLQLTPTRTICDAATDLEHLDPEALKGYLTPHRSGLHLLAAPMEPARAEAVSAEQITSILRMLKKSFRYLIVDTPPSFSEHVLCALDQTDVIVASMTMDVPSIKNLRLAIQTLGILGWDRERIRIVLNRADTQVGIDLKDVEKTLDTRVDVKIPSSRDVPLSINRGSPIVEDNPKSSVARAIKGLVDSVDGPPATKRVHRKLLGLKR